MEKRIRGIIARDGLILMGIIVLGFSLLFLAHYAYNNIDYPSHFDIRTARPAEQPNGELLVTHHFFGWNSVFWYRKNLDNPNSLVAFISAVIGNSGLVILFFGIMGVIWSVVVYLLGYPIRWLILSKEKISAMVPSTEKKLLAILRDKELLIRICLVVGILWLFVSLVKMMF